MFFIALAATALLAATDASATPAPTETQPAAAAAAAKPQPKTRKVCYVDPAATGSRMAHKVCHTEVVKEDAPSPDAPKTEQK